MDADYTIRLATSPFLIYPVTDNHTPPNPSYLANANGYLLTRDMRYGSGGTI